jgi:hypothetical protein
MSRESCMSWEIVWVEIGGVRSGLPVCHEVQIQDFLWLYSYHYSHLEYGKQSRA